MKHTPVEQWGPSPLATLEELQWRLLAILADIFDVEMPEHIDEVEANCDFEHARSEFPEAFAASQQEAHLLGTTVERLIAESMVRNTFREWFFPALVYAASDAADAYVAAQTTGGER